MGSSFAGVKAGIISGVVFAGSLGALNYLTFTLFRSSTIAILSQYLECSGGTAHSAEECFQTLLTVSVPLSIFLSFSISLIFAFIFGRFFESFPRRNYFVKALIPSYLMLFILYYFLSGIIIIPGFVSIETDRASQVLLISLDLVATLAYAYVLGAFYRRYTRIVEFSSPEPDPVKIFVGKRDVTGKTITFSTRSSHKLVAEATGKRLFKEWSYSGGVTVEDPRSYETVLMVEGNGMLRAYSTTPG